MELAKRNFQSDLSHLAEHFTLDDVKNNLYFLMLLNIVFLNNVEQPYEMIKIIDPENHEDIILYTHNKFLEVYDSHGLDGFIS